MEIKKVIPFSRLRWWMYILSIVMVVVVWGLTFLQGGFNLGIDFKPGLSETVQINSSNVSIETVRAALKGSEHNFTVQPIGPAADRTFQLRAVASAAESKVSNLQEVISGKALVALEGTFGDGNVKVLSSQFIGPSLSDALVIQTFWITLAALIVILLYIWFRFKFAYAVAAIVALIHDPVFIMGFIGTVQMEVTTATIAVILTIIGYSLNDTIVVFDRIRENIRLQKASNMYDLIDLSITQTLSRTIVSSVTVVLSMFALVVFNEGAVRDFAWALIIGVVVGTYSSIFVAAPLMVAIAGGKPPKEKEKKVEVEGAVQA